MAIFLTWYRTKRCDIGMRNNMNTLSICGRYFRLESKMKTLLFFYQTGTHKAEYLKAEDEKNKKKIDKFYLKNVNIV